MAKYIVLAFDNDDEADIFADGTEMGDVFYRSKDTGYRYFEDLVEKGKGGVGLVGVWKRPTQFCECDGDKKGWTRGVKYGWMLHSECRKPSRQAYEDEEKRISYILGTNLHERQEQPQQSEEQPQQ